MKVLIAEDDFTSRRILENLMARWGYEVISVADGNEAWAILQEKTAPRLAILDWILPGMDGASICREIRSSLQSGWDYLYVILLTSRDSKDDIILGLEAGADDYVVKPFDPTELKMRLQVGRRILELHEALRYHASHDPLTHVLNRGAIFKLLKAEISRSERRNSPLSVGLLDIDHFKAVNDTHGHIVGDIVLCEVVNRIGDALRDYDTIGRYGGEEFLIIVPGVDESTVMDVFERVKKKICATDISGEEAMLKITVSIGVCVYSPGMGLDRFLGLADTALYEAKAEGRNCIRVRRQPELKEEESSCP